MLYARLKKVVYSLLLCWMLFSVHPAGAESVQIESIDAGKQDISDRLMYLIDNEDNIDISDIANEDLSWIRIEDHIVNLGFFDKPVWFRVDFDSRSIQNLIYYLEIDSPILDSIDFYQLRGGSVVSGINTGDTRLFSSRALRHRNFIFPVSVIEGENHIYFRVRTDSVFRFNAVLYSTYAFRDYYSNGYLLIGLYFGMLLMLILINFLLLINTRNLSTLFLLLLNTFLVLYLLAQRGLAYQFLWPDNFWLQEKSTLVLMMLSALSAMLFFFSYFRIGVNKRILGLLNTFIIVIPYSILIILCLLFPYHKLANVTILYLSTFPVMSLIVILSSLSQFKKSAIYILIGFSGFIVGIPLNILYAYAIVDLNVFSQWIIELALLWFSVFASVSYAVRFDILNKELRIQERRLSFAMEATSDSIFDYYPFEQRIYLSKRWYEITGYNENELTGSLSSLIELIHEEDREAFKTIMLKEPLAQKSFILENAGSGTSPENGFGFSTRARQLNGTTAGSFGG